MKKIINGKRYDTSTAKLCGSDSYSNPRDFHYWHEELYRKNTGEFFLYGEGGPMSRYAESCGQNGWTGGERIIPLSYESAGKWAEVHIDVDEYERIFGEVAEDDSKLPIGFHLSASTIERLKRKAAMEDSGLSEIVERVLTEALQ